MNSQSVDPRAWIAWAIAMSLPPMLGRNPFPLIAVLIVALAVRAGVQSSETGDWGHLLRLSLIFAGIGVLFNLITYHGGDVVLFTLPEWIPIIGGPITLNALVFGLLGGLALVALVTIWSTVSSQLDWSALIRLTPPGLGGLAVSSSIAVTLVPKTLEAFGEIRDVQTIRGFAYRRPRDMASLVSPLLTLGLERAVTLSEALESRGFGGPERASHSSRREPFAIATALTALAVAAFMLSTGRESSGIVALVAAGVAAWLATRWAGSRESWRPTSYREVSMRTSDWIIVASSAVAAIAILAINRVDRAAFFYEPYPAIAWPALSIPALLAISLLLAPLVAQSTINVRGD